MTAPIAIPRYFAPELEASILQTSVRGLTMRFAVRRSMAVEPDTCELSIAGLASARLQAMAALFNTLGTSTLQLRGGYSGALAGIFTGDVRSFRGPVREGGDTWAHIMADDGGDAISNTIVRIPSPAASTLGLTAQQMIEVAAAAMSLTLDPSVAAVVSASDPTTQGPYTAVQTSRAVDLLDAACRRIRARWWVRDGKILLGRKGVVPAKATRIPNGAVIQEPATAGSGLMRAVVFFDPNLVPGGQAVIGTQAFRIESAAHAGETNSAQVWTSDIVGRAL